MALHSCSLAWRLPWAEKPGGLQSNHRVTKSQTGLSSAEHQKRGTHTGTWNTFKNESQAPKAGLNASQLHHQFPSRTTKNWAWYYKTQRLKMKILAEHWKKTHHIQKPKMKNYGRWMTLWKHSDRSDICRSGRGASEVTNVPTTWSLLSGLLNCKKENLFFSATCTSVISWQAQQNIKHNWLHIEILTHITGRDE